MFPHRNLQFLLRWGKLALLDLQGFRQIAVWIARWGSRSDFAARANGGAGECAVFCAQVLGGHAGDDTDGRKRTTRNHGKRVGSGLGAGRKPDGGDRPVWYAMALAVSHRENFMGGGKLDQ